MRPWLFAILLIAGCAKQAGLPQSDAKKPPAPASLSHSAPKLTTAAIEVYFVRHGETVSNATGVYRDSTLNKLTPAGEAQAKFVAQALSGVRFDAAIVSPSLRAQITAAETLREHNLVATIWPEMNECCTQHGAARLEPASYRMPKGGRAPIPTQLASILKLDDDDSLIYAPANYSDGIVQTQIAAARFTAMFTHYPQQPPDNVVRVLVVGHAAQGSRFLDLLLDKPPIGDIEIKNGSITVLRKEPMGVFKLTKKIENPNKSKQDSGKMSSKTEK